MLHSSHHLPFVPLLPLLSPLSACLPSNAYTFMVAPPTHVDHSYARHTHTHTHTHTGSCMITCGEHEYNKFGFKRLLEMKCTDILQPDITWMGGITEARRIVAMAAAQDIPVVPHGRSCFCLSFFLFMFFFPLFFFFFIFVFHLSFTLSLPLLLSVPRIRLSIDLFEVYDSFLVHLTFFIHTPPPPPPSLLLPPSPPPLYHHHHHHPSIRFVCVFLSFTNCLSKLSDCRVDQLVPQSGSDCALVWPIVYW